MSQQSPDWFKGPFQNNANYFSKLNRVLSHKEEPIPLKGHLYPTGRVANGTIVNNGAPEWIRTTHDRNKEHFHSSRRSLASSATSAGASHVSQSGSPGVKGGHGKLRKEDPRLTLSQTRSLRSLGDAMRDRLVSEMYHRGEDPVSCLMTEVGRRQEDTLYLTRTCTHDRQRCL